MFLIARSLRDYQKLGKMAIDQNAHQRLICVENSRLDSHLDNKVSGTLRYLWQVKINTRRNLCVQQ